MKTKIAKLGMALVALALLVLSVVVLKKNKETTQQRVYQYNKETPIRVQADTLHLAYTNEELSYSGSFEPNKETKLSADIQGKITSMPAELGSRVAKGQALVQLDQALLSLQLQSAELQVEGLEADLKRYRTLAAADAIQGVQLEKTELALKTAKVQRATLQEQIQKTSIKAPFAGIVTAKLTEEGAFAAPGMPLVQVTDIARLKFTIHLPEQALQQFAVGQKHPIVVEALPELSLQGQVSMVGSKANVGNSFPVQFSVDNTHELSIKAGMTGRVRVTPADKPTPQLHIPASAILGTHIRPQVYVVENNQAVLRNVRIAKRVGNQAIIAEGLREGDLLIASGFVNLYDGARVTLKND